MGSTDSVDFTVSLDNCSSGKGLPDGWAGFFSVIMTLGTSVRGTDGSEPSSIRGPSDGQEGHRGEGSSEDKCVVMEARDRKTTCEGLGPAWEASVSSEESVARAQRCGIKSAFFGGI